MSDDIVTRLLDFTPLKDADLARLMLDAAEEIKNLRNDIKVRDLQIRANFRSMDAMHRELYGDVD